jgi:DNA topoisomerase IB
VNEYLREITGQDFTAKDFRTWAGTILAAEALCECKSFATQKQAKRNITMAAEKVAEKLGNTVAICKKCYIHPAVFDAYIRGKFVTLRRPPSPAVLARWGKEFASKPQLTLKQALMKSVKSIKRNR